ncbi:hypothetical protein ACJX0J_031096, partial [Zea mays]
YVFVEDLWSKGVRMWDEHKKEPNMAIIHTKKNAPRAKKGTLVVLGSDIISTFSWKSHLLPGELHCYTLEKCLNSRETHIGGGGGGGEGEERIFFVEKMKEGGKKSSDSTACRPNNSLRRFMYGNQEGRRWDDDTFSCCHYLNFN